MQRPGFLLAFFACGVLLALPQAPLRADVILSADDAGQPVPGESLAPAASGAALADALPADAPERVGSLISEEEAWILPVGAAFILGTGIVFFLIHRNNSGSHAVL